MRKLLLIGALLLACSLPALAQSVESERAAEMETLRGLEEVAVVVTSEVKQAGFDSAYIKAAVQTRLQRAGLRIIRAGDKFEAMVYITLTDGDNNSLLLRVRLLQLATLLRTEKVILMPTWERLKVVAGSKATVPDALAALLDELIRDLKAMN